MGWRTKNKDHITDGDMRKDVLWSKAGQRREAKNCVPEEREETDLSQKGRSILSVVQGQEG